MSAARPRDEWLEPARAHSKAALRLLCLPYAGGSSTLFRDWQAELPARIDVAPVLLPGRDRQRRDVSLATLQDLARELARGLEPHLHTRYALFGHSMGALLAFELCHALLALDLPLPEHLFVAGFRAPQLPDRNPILHGLPEDEFVEALEHLGATPPEILEFDGILALLLPTIRGDLRLVEIYRFSERPKLAVPLTAICARDDALVSCKEMSLWREQTSAAFELVELEGTHFFLESARPELLATIAKRTAQRA